MSKLIDFERLLNIHNVPKRLWPRLIMREEYRLLIAGKNDEESRRIIEKKRQSEWDKEEDSRFIKWIIFLLWLLDNNKQATAIPFFHECYRAMNDREEGSDRAEGSFVQQSFLILALISFPFKEVESALSTALPIFKRNMERFNRGEVINTFPLPHAIFLLSQLKKDELNKIVFTPRKVCDEQDADEVSSSHVRHIVMSKRPMVPFKALPNSGDEGEEGGASAGSGAGRAAVLRFINRNRGDKDDAESKFKPLVDRPRF